MVEIIEPKPTRSTTYSYWGEGVITLPLKASTRSRLHELAHKKFGHEPGVMTVSTFVDRELEAEAYAYKMMDKPISYKIGIPILSELINDWDFGEDKVLNLVVRRLRHMGIKVSRTDSRKLGEFAYKEVA